MKPFLAVLAVTLALPVSALARPAQDQPVRHQAPAVHALGTDVAAPDQQASKLPTSGPVVVSSDGFDWSAAGIGAASGIVLLLAMLGAGSVVRRRRHTSAAAF